MSLLQGILYVFMSKTKFHVNQNDFLDHVYKNSLFSNFGKFCKNLET